MSTVTVGSLFSGYEGIGLALKEVFDADPIWFSEFDKAASKVLAHHYPDVPNLGDITKIDWSVVTPPTIVCGGSPCQDMSTAGKGAGMKAGTRSGLWSYMRDAIAALRPSLVVWENVRGALSADADSDMEPCAGCVGDGDDGPVLRALGRVLGDLAGIGYDAAWTGLRAADVGAPHGRFRVFVLAWPAAQDADLAVGAERRFAAPGQAEGWGARADARGRDRAPVAEDRLTLLPTPAVNDMGAGKTVDAWDAWTASMQAKHGNGNGHGASLSIEALRLLPTPRATRGGSGTETMYGLGAVRSDENRTQGQVLMPSAVQPVNFGRYTTAIERWEAITRPAPSPTEPTGKGGAQRLSPRFEEWMMDVPDGWITDVPGVSHNDAIKMLGNGVVKSQAAAAIRHLLGIQANALRRAA
ncbi:MAG: DNA cytosine methyltransferase [Actinomycetales bacterium]|nr:DNA cytosine methyltransferase [Actinomycetales bacterium]